MLFLTYRPIPAAPFEASILDTTPDRREYLPVHGICLPEPKAPLLSLPRDYMSGRHPAPPLTRVVSPATLRPVTGATEGGGGTA